ncbi:MAG: N-acetyl-gamma-glutamyl-phosphate reductase [Candidatus Eisenbacteria bacterium]|nr:N-acetyl-gamma-glutamyl-phosphate reductase [Candidatus Latescibacterota bacterium]MBD3301511.1 N-acetyl-gamma-glutamyl-phosphate reductase [Candidatus Eisenbacteria bacterium]
MKRARVAIVGATGYTGSELVRLLSEHPHAEIGAITSRSRAGEPFSAVHGAFRRLADQVLVQADALPSREIDLLFLALPHGTSMDFVAAQPTDGPPIIDLSGDFRLPDPAAYTEWYGAEHRAKDRLEEAVFGLPELFRDQVRDAKLVSNPGCYPTCAILALAPLLRRGLVRPSGIIVDAKSGVTGAGASVKASTHFPDVFGDFRAYKLVRHRHTPEIESALSRVAGTDVQVLFTPHLLPVDRGILATCYAEPTGEADTDSLRAAYREDYADEPFVRLVEEPPSIKQVRGSNYCDVQVTYDPRTRRVLALATIDNLVKGAAGQAIQNMNLLFGWPETTGLTQGPLTP